MKKTFVFLICLLVCFSFAVAEGFTDSGNAYEDPQEKIEAPKKIEQNKTTACVINIPDGLGNGKKYMSDEILSTIGSIKVEYFPLYGEARFFYTCMMVHYDKGDAMSAIIEISHDFLDLLEFTDENGDTHTKDRYYRYSLLPNEKERYFKNERGFAMAQYITSVRFTK